MQMVRLKSLDEVQSLPLTDWKVRQPAEVAQNDAEDALNSGNDYDLMRQCDQFLPYL